MDIIYSNICCIFRVLLALVHNCIDNKQIIPNVSSSPGPHIAISEIIINSLVFFIVDEFVEDVSEYRGSKNSSVGIKLLLGPFVFYINLSHYIYSYDWGRTILT